MYYDQFLEEFGAQNGSNANMDELANYLAAYIKRNAEIRKLKVNHPEAQESLMNISLRDIPAQGRNSKEVADELVRDVFEQATPLQHPRFFSYVSSSVSPYSLAGSVLTDIYNLNGGGWELAPAACMIEEKLIKWCASRAGMPQETCGGLFTSGGSMSNLTALTAARNEKVPEQDIAKAVAFISDQTHVCVSKSLRIIGISRDNIVSIPTDDAFRMRTDLLRGAICAAKEQGLIPFVIIGTMGTTNTGSIDPLSEMADIAEEYGLWLHVDGAYGGSLLFSDKLLERAEGINRVDSLSWDFHKMAMQVYSCSAVIVRDRSMLLNIFTEHPEYLSEAIEGVHCDPWNLGPELSRPHRALKLWYTLQAMGTDAMAAHVELCCDHARAVVHLLESRPDWEIMHEPQFSAICFRYAPRGYLNADLDDLNALIARRVTQEGYSYIVNTTLKGVKVLRLCFTNASTLREDVVSSIQYLDEVAKECAKEVLGQ